LPTLVLNSEQIVLSAYRYLGRHAAVKMWKAFRLPRGTPTHQSTMMAPCPCLSLEAAPPPRPHLTTSGGWILLQGLGTGPHLMELIRLLRPARC
jgi:hypothetical protein